MMATMTSSDCYAEARLKATIIICQRKLGRFLQRIAEKESYAALYKSKFMCERYDEEIEELYTKVAELEGYVLASELGLAQITDKRREDQAQRMARILQISGPALVPTPSAAVTPPPNQQSDSRRTIFNVIILVIVLAAAGAAYLFFSDSNKGKSSKKQTLKYADEIAIKLNSQETSEAFKKQESKSRQKQSSAYLRAEENFSKGMRAFQLGNYSSAVEFFQLTLTTNSEHVLAKRYLYLAKVRFDEIVKAKLDLGQSYFERNNFKLCKSMFQQVIDMLSSKEMLQGPSKDTNLQSARIMQKKCEFAAEGIH